MILQVLFESSWDLKNSKTVFKYQNQIFKLFRGKKSSHLTIKGFRYKKPWPGMDCLATVADEPLYPNEIGKMVLSYLGCLSWENKTEIVYRSQSGFGTSLKIKEDLSNLGQMSFARRNIFRNNKYLIISQIPFCSSGEHLTAVGLYREAMASDSPFYKFLCFWNILSIRGSAHTSGWVNRALRSRFPLHNFSQIERELIKAHQKIGEFFEENFRDAVAHIKRSNPTSFNTLDVNDPKDFSKFYVGSRILEKLARFYVEEDLGMNQKLHLFPGKIKEYRLL